MSKEAIKLALEALDDTGWQTVKARKILEEALAKQEQGEPHSWYSAQEDEWMTEKTRKDHERLNSYTHKVGGFDLPLYTTPQQRKPLTDETRNWIVATCPTPRHIIDAVERMHGIKGQP